MILYMYIPPSHPIRLYMCNYSLSPVSLHGLYLLYNIVPNNKFKSVTLVMNSSQFIPTDFQKFLADFT